MSIANDSLKDSSVYYDPYDVDITANPYPTYARLREEAPIYHNERYDFWALSRHADVDRALSDGETFSNSRSDILELVKSDFDMPKGVMMFEDPPVHTMLRGLMSRVFTPRRMAEIEDQIRRFCVNCLDPHVGSSGFDIIAELASMMPMRVIGMLLGIPESEQVSVRNANDANLRTKPGAPMKVVKADAIADGRIYADYVEWRSNNPSDDLMTALLNVEFDDENGVTRKLTRKEVLHYTQVVAGAGNETTGRLIGWLAKVLAEHPDQRREVVADRTLLLRVVDETLRFEPTGPHVARYIARDFECYGTTVPAGSAMLLLFGAANRDPSRYTDPDRFDIHRDNISHLTFGKGLHYCLGANLARLEGRVALDELLNRWPEWDIDYDSAQLAPTSTVRGWERLRIVLPQARANRCLKRPRWGDDPATSKFVRRLAAVIGVASAPFAALTVVTPAVSSAQPLDCGNGWWDPVANVCRPPAVQPLLCENGWWWDPVANVCRPPAVPPPLLCENGWWWDPVANVCRPPLIPPPA